MAEAVMSSVNDRFPRLARILRVGAFHALSEAVGIVRLWQVERDLELVARRVGSSQIEKAYGDSLRNDGEFLGTMYEIRAVAMLAPFVDRLALRPTLGAGSCDLRCEVGGKDVFVEVTTRNDTFPFEKAGKKKSGKIDEGRAYSRRTIAKSFDTTTAREEPLAREESASQELRERIEEKMRQLPSGQATVVVVGAPNGRSLDMECALWGDERFRTSPAPMRKERVLNGLFAIPDEVGGTSGLSAVVWMKLARHFHDIRVYGRLFENPRAAHPLPPEALELFQRVFDRRAILERERERIQRLLVEQYHPDRIILFGSLSRADLEDKDTVHEWSDIDLAVVKSTSLPFWDRAREIMDLVRPRVGLNVLVYTPKEFDQLEHAGQSFVRDEILKKGRVLFPNG